MLKNDSPVFLYQQLQNLIRDDIMSGKYPEGSQMPSESELGDMYQVSRITVRRALKELAKEGLIEVRHGKGTFVKSSRLDLHLLDLMGFSELQLKPHHYINRTILEKEVIRAPEEVKAPLRLGKGDQVLRLKRLIRLDGEPFSIDTAFFPLALYPGLEDKIADDLSTFQILRNDYGIKMAKVHKELEVITADPAASDLLRCNLGAPLYLVRKLIEDLQGRAVHFSQYTLLASRVKWSLSLDLTKDTQNGDDQSKGTAAGQLTPR